MPCIAGSCTPRRQSSSARRHGDAAMETASCATAAGGEGLDDLVLRGWHKVERKDELTGETLHLFIGPEGQTCATVHEVSKAPGACQVTRRIHMLPQRLPVQHGALPRARRVGHAAGLPAAGPVERALWSCKVTFRENNYQQILELERRHLVPFLFSAECPDLSPYLLELPRCSLGGVLPCATCGSTPTLDSC